MSQAVLERKTVWIGRSSDHRVMRGDGDFKADRDSIVIVLTDHATDEQIIEAAAQAAIIRHGRPQKTT